MCEECAKDVHRLSKECAKIVQRICRGCARTSGARNVNGLCKECKDSMCRRNVQEICTKCALLACRCAVQKTRLNAKIQQILRKSAIMISSDNLRPAERLPLLAGQSGREKRRHKSRGSCLLEIMLQSQNIYKIRIFLTNVCLELYFLKFYELKM